MINYDIYAKASCRLPPHPPPQLSSCCRSSLPPSLSLCSVSLCLFLSWFLFLTLLNLTIFSKHRGCAGICFHFSSLYSQQFHDFFSLSCLKSSVSLIKFLLSISSWMKCQHLILNISITVFTLYSRPAILFLDHSQAKLISFLLFLSLLLIISILTIPSLPAAIFSVYTFFVEIHFTSLHLLPALSCWKLLCHLSICCIWLRSLPLVFATYPLYLLL